MSTYKSEYRITAWPGDRLPHPPLLRRPYRLSTDLSVLQPMRPIATTDPEMAVETAGETYLKLRVLDVSDLLAITRFASEYSVLGIRTDGFAALRGITEISRARDRLKREVDRRKKSSSIGEWNDERVQTETVAEFRFAAALLHDLTNFALISRGTRERFEWHTLRETGCFIDSVARADDRRYYASQRLRDALNPALAPFHPRLMVRAPENLAGQPITPKTAAAVDFASASLYSICALELFNHLAEDAQYRRCANDSCQRLFVRQEGRARAGQHRTKGVHFCSERCLRQQKQREYRQRKKGAM